MPFSFSSYILAFGSPLNRSKSFDLLCMSFDMHTLYAMQHRKKSLRICWTLEGTFTNFNCGDLLQQHTVLISKAKLPALSANTYSQATIKTLVECPWALFQHLYCWLWTGIFTLIVFATETQYVEQICFVNINLRCRLISVLNYQGKNKLGIQKWSK